MGSTPPVVALAYLSWGSDVIPTDRTYRHWQFLCVTKMSKILNFLVNTWIFYSSKCTKTRFQRTRWGSLRVTTLLQTLWSVVEGDTLVSGGVGHPLPIPLRRLDLAAFGASLLNPEFFSANCYTADYHRKLISTSGSPLAHSC